MDEDGSGSITLQDVESMKESSLRAIDALDTDYDSRITYSDVNGMRKALGNLAILDVDEDGMVSIEDVSAALDLA